MSTAKSVEDLLAARDSELLKAVSKLKEDAYSQLYKAKKERDMVQTTFEECQRDLHTATSAKKDMKNELEKEQKQRQLASSRLDEARSERKEALCVAGSTALRHEIEMSRLNMTVEIFEKEVAHLKGQVHDNHDILSRDLSESALSEASETGPSKNAQASPPPASFKQKKSARTSPTSRRSPKQTECDRTELNQESVRVFVPPGCTAFPGKLYARDVAYILDRQPTGTPVDVIMVEFAAMLPGVKFVYPTYRRHRIFWAGASPADRDAARNLPRTPDGRWSKWVRTSAAWKIYNEKNRQARKAKVVEADEFDELSEDPDAEVESESEEEMPMWVEASGWTTLKRRREARESEEHDAAPRKRKPRHATSSE
ncbi:hypothetical protein C8R43DRAFT_1110673 [Mycena crocata]|nr:hypothetical protein C8R43DRAFT_1110673 [Mycena crocata]